VVIGGGPSRTAAPRHGTIDFSEDTPEQRAHEGPPPAVQHGTLMPKKYLQPGTHSGVPQLDDPFAVPGRRGAPGWRLGARVAAGVTGHEDARVGYGVAALAMRPIARRVALSARLGWNHRAVDVIGADAGFAAIVVATESLAVIAGGALRGEVRVQDALAMAPVERVGLGVSADLALALRDVPLVIGLRGEHGASELVAGIRPRALWLELGYELR
jgi:hypothetical protein